MELRLTTLLLIVAILPLDACRSGEGSSLNDFRTEERVTGKESPEDRMKRWYDSARSHYGQGEYGPAAVCLEKAAREAGAAGNRHYEGLTYRLMADISNVTFNVREDSLSLLRALEAFRASGDSLHMAETILRLAVAYYNDHQWEKAAEAYRLSLQLSGSIPPLRNRCLASYGSFLLDAPSGEPEQALASFEDVLRSGEALSDNKLCDYGFALYLSGRKEQGMRLLDSLGQFAAEVSSRLDYRRYRIFRLEGEDREALLCLERRAMEQDSLFRTQASEAVSRAQRDYMEVVAQNERLEKERERETRRAAVAWGVLGIALLVLSGVVVLGNERAKRVKDRQALADARRLSERLQEAERQHLNRIHSLERDVRKKQSTLEEVRSDYLFMFRSGYRRLGNLFEARHFAESQQQNEKVLCQKVAEILREIDGDRKGFRKLRKFIEDNLDKPISHLISDIPGLKEVDVQLFCYLVIGYDASLISLLMGIDSLNTVYSRKNRLVGRIKKLPPAKARRYLDLIA